MSEKHFERKFCAECRAVEMYFDDDCIVCHPPMLEGAENFVNVPVRTGRRPVETNDEPDDEPDFHERQLPTGDR